MREITVDLNIPADEYLAIYQGVARDILAVSRDGRKVRFPATSLQRYVTHNGISGTFTIYFDDDNKLMNVVRC